MAETILITIFIILAVFAIPLVYFLFKKAGHGIKHLFFAFIICIMLTSIIQLGIFYFIMRYSIFEKLCDFGLDCNALFAGFVKLSLYSSIGIFAILLSVYYLFHIMKGLLKWGVIIIGIFIILAACFIVYKSYVPNNSIMPDTTLCSINEDCLVIQDKENVSSMNNKFIEGRLEDIPDSLNETPTCMYKPICVENKCKAELRDNASLCGK